VNLAGLQLRRPTADQWHANDVLSNRNLDTDVGSDGNVAETVAINPVAAVMQDCASTEIGKKYETAWTATSPASRLLSEVKLADGPRHRIP
jgi:hypothetical protein